MLQLYLVLGFLSLESFIVFLFLLPRFVVLRPFQRLISRILGARTTRIVLIVCFVILSFLLLESYQEMRYREAENREKKDAAMPETGIGMMMHKSSMFRSQRNFYLTFFTFGLYLIMFRLRGIHAEFDVLDARLGEQLAPKLDAAIDKISKKLD